MFVYDSFTFVQVVALMGAHSLGGALQVNSGYQGKWTGKQNIGFNELYYLNMINATNKWTNVVRFCRDCNFKLFECKPFFMKILQMI